jgi:hypothetical protein
MILEHDIGESLALLDRGRDVTLWKYVYGGKPKPYFHPICTPSGHVLTLFEPHDHVWHRGLWFTIKFVNGENFWEEHEPYGTQQTSELPHVEIMDDGSIGVSTMLEWIRPNSSEAVLLEDRAFSWIPVSEDAYALEFDTVLTATQPVTLDRTPFTTWGGYGGLTFRGNRNWQQTRLLFADGGTSDRPTPYRSEWCDLSGKLDGGKDLSGGIAIFDYPENPNHPVPWYGSTGAGHYFNAAFLFEEPMELDEDDELYFHYRVLVHDGVWDHDRLAQSYQDWLTWLESEAELAEEGDGME